MGCLKDIKLRLSWVTKKEAYIYLSFTLLVLLLAAIVNDAVRMLVTEETEYTTQLFSQAILFVHAVAFYLGLLGFVYVTQTAGDTMMMAWRALAAVLGNSVIFILRVAYEVKYFNYRMEVYHA